MSHKTRVHIDSESDDVEAEVARLEKLGAKNNVLLTSAAFAFLVMTDPFDNEFCVLQPEYPDLLANRPDW